MLFLHIYSLMMQFLSFSVELHSTPRTLLHLDYRELLKIHIKCKFNHLSRGDSINSKSCLRHTTTATVMHDICISVAVFLSKYLENIIHL